MTSTETGIIKAVVYADLFDFPLTKSEIFKWYVGNTPVSINTIDQVLKIMVAAHFLECKGDYYFLPGKNQLVQLRKNRLLPSTQKHMRAVAVARQLRHIPGVEGVAVTGTVAVENAQHDDDIDMMIITRAGQLWTTRLWATVYLDIRGLRRKPNQEEVNDAVCVNLYMDTKAMSVPKSRQNLYTAHEVVQAVFISQKDDVALRFLQANRWIKHYLPNTVIATKRFVNSRQNNNHWLERLSYQLQRWYMRGRMTREWVTPSQAYFHPTDMAKIILSRYDQSLKQYELT